nr:MAG TPA: hypothetical protein [Bacteriophage sp.]
MESPRGLSGFRYSLYVLGADVKSCQAFCLSFRAESAGRFLLYVFFLIIHGDFLYYIPFRRISSRYPAMNLCPGEGLFPLTSLLSAPAPATTHGQVFVLPFKA